MFRHLFPKIFRISLAGVFLIIILSIVALTISNRDNIIAKFQHISPVANESFTGQIEQINNNKVISMAVIVITWSGIGLVAYTVIWIGMLIITEARNEIVIETEYVNRGPLKDRLKAPLTQIGILICLLIVLALSFNNLFALWSVFFAQFLWLIPADIPIALLNLLAAVGGLTLNAYVIKVIATALVSIE